MSKFQVGDEVIDSQRGEGVVIEISSGFSSKSQYPVRAKINNRGDFTYMSGGHRDIRDINPALFHKKGYIPPSAPEPKRLPDLAVDTKMLVGAGKDKRHFSHWNDSGECCCFDDGATSFTTDVTCGWETWDVYIE